MKIFLTRELVDLKHKVLLERIEKVNNNLKNIAIVVNCENEINSLKIIKQQYEKMYQAILESGEYDKYQEVESIIIAKLANIEAKIDRYIYRSRDKIAIEIQQYVDNIEDSENYKNFKNLDKEQEKVRQLKMLLKMCSQYYSQEQEQDLYKRIMDVKFKILIRKQLRQIVYENGGDESNLNQYDNETEKEYFKELIEGMIQKLLIKGLEKECESEELLAKYDAETVMSNNTILNHLIFKTVEQEIETNPYKYISLLQAKIFNPHMCTIANSPYKKYIPWQATQIDYAPIANYWGDDEGYRYQGYVLNGGYYYRTNCNFSLLVAVLKNIISEECTTIMECDNIFQRFGFECRPLIVNEGQELLRKIFNKVKRDLKPKEKDTSKTNGKFCRLKFAAFDYDYDFPRLAGESQFFTLAQIWEEYNRRYPSSYEEYYYNNKIEMLSEEQNLTLQNIREAFSARIDIEEHIMRYYRVGGEWMKEALYEVIKMREARIKYYYRNNEFPLLSPRAAIKHYNALWQEYQSDFKKLNIQIGKTEIFASKQDVGNLEHYRSMHSDEREVTHANAKWAEGIKSYYLTFDTYINLDDIADLPIDFSKIRILTKEEMAIVRAKEGIENFKSKVEKALEGR